MEKISCFILFFTNHIQLNCLIWLTCIITFSYSSHAQKLCIIDNIHGLESSKDPKCHATANRLENFMYGTPLDDATRETKVELQKKLILYIWNLATKKSNELKSDTITEDILAEIINPLCDFGSLKTGDFYFVLGENVLTIAKNDLRQYTSVAYSLRAMLSVEQDFLFNPNWNLTPLSYEATSKIKLFVDMATLASLKLSDQYARQENARFLTPSYFKRAWDLIFKKSQQKEFIKSQYPKINATSEAKNDYTTIKQIINQKIASYNNYNEISLPILLRNIQVYFARHRWPSDTEASDKLKSYLIESLVFLSSDIIKRADIYADETSDLYIRANHLNQAANEYLPISINQFEDVTYFPKLEEKLTIESYDLDAFRDSGLHWKILEYALTNLDPQTISELDPFAAEILVETVAQWALIVLRITGNFAIQNGNEVINVSDMEMAFQYIQDLIYKHEKVISEQTNEIDKIASVNSEGTIDEKIFYDKTEEIGIDFYHKSSDWLSRLIRSYVVKENEIEKVIRMAIPPAFGGSGVGAEDINNDGFPDLLLTGGMGNKLYLNDKNGGFKEITETAGINIWYDDIKSYAEIRQCIIVDFNNDGWQDLFFTLVNDTHQLFKNIDGQHFDNVTAQSNFGGKGKVGGPATALDFDNDGLLDIYIGYFGNYINGELPTLDRNNQNGSRNVLFRNKGEFTFEEVSHISDNESDNGWTQALVHLDINQDGYQDLVIGNDFGINAYYINNQDGTFSNRSKDLNTNKPSYTMSIGSADLNKDLLPDLYISNIVVMEKDEKYVSPTGETKMNFDPKKMQNIRTVEANDLFISNKTNNDLPSFSLSQNVGRGYSSTGWSWDADFFDFDNDGDDDLYCLNGMNDFRVYGSENPFYNSPDGSSLNVIYAQSNKEKNVFFVNDGGMLKEQSSIIGGDLNSNSRSAAYFDLENDGDLDIIINNYHDQAVFLKNESKSENNWIAIKLIGSPDDNINLDAIGTSLIVTGSEGFQNWREIHSTTGYLSVHPKEQHFGVGKLKNVDLKIKWSNGKEETFENLDVNNRYEIVYGGNPKIK
ncbi:MAG: CRTAC1 family protein [Saprospiraceae bacterium]|nr:CRTAC1 family protein [Bacteroidia bacterium]NNE14131.1 CRTAC1 family protein [Saprospiraceae bacterium]NNL90956.1 CRTAC1 family protein [Saprospiraceae bacterium]